MIAFLADEDFNNRIVRGLLRRQPDIDIVRVQDIELAGAPDAAILEWAAQNGRVLLTHDVSTLTHFAQERMRAGERMAGVIEVPQSAPIGQIIEDLLLIAAISTPEEYEDRIDYLPL
ncbi:conserved protein of unknown function [Candidatus Promineifilum breve]|uniref:DUF5615 domain-containing protein n=1 Tax=Candidatus Promineifilum breve TaxID=1806508 RepID=A0A160T3R5_9CHLR|nr:DUF5615 family PIN-like protein [Candidatus Promineifilum breve]CUS04382.2 conserved protein of unknown function [Candidatus Promineifilum breve]